MKTRNLIVSLAWLWPALAFPQHTDWTEAEREAFDLHREEIAAPTEFLGEDAFASIQADYTVRPGDARAIRRLCRQMETRKYLHNFILETSEERLRSKREIGKHYLDSLAMLLIPANPGMAGRFIGYAVSMKEELGLTEEQRNFLLEQAVGFARRQRTAPCADYGREETAVLKTVLDAGQTERIINARNTPAAAEKTSTVWTALAVAGLNGQLDSIEDCRRACRYYLKESFISDYYAGDAELTAANLEDLHRHKPRIVTMYEGLRQRTAIRRKHEEKVGREFTW
jgi:hypothetical protein